MSSAAIEAMTLDFLAAHGGFRDADINVRALSLERADEDGHADRLQESMCDSAGVQVRHGIVNERDPRYIAQRRKFILMNEQRVNHGENAVTMAASYAPVAEGDSMSNAELEYLLKRAAHLILDIALPKKSRNFLTRLIDGLVNEHDLLRWLPKILQMREDGLLS